MVLAVLILIFTFVAAMTGVMLVKFERDRRRDEARSLIEIDHVVGTPDRPFVPWLTAIDVGLTLHRGRVSRGYRIAIALEDGSTIAASPPRDLPEGGTTTITVPISPPQPKDQVVIVNVLNNWNRTVKSERRRV